jgi:hypothetical protein
MLNFGGSVDATSATSPASAAHRIPAIHATLRDHQVKKDGHFLLEQKFVIISKTDHFYDCV